MSKTYHFAAVDLGASSGRVMRCSLVGERLTLEEVHRFENRAVFVPDADAGRWCWDTIGLWHHVKHGLREAGRRGAIDAIGIDTWGVDYALLDEHGRLVASPIAYRDPRTDRTYPRVIEQLGKAAIYRHTGIQFMSLNTLYQLSADAQDPSRSLERAHVLLMMPQLLGYWLTGRQVAEHTLASTTQCYDSVTRSWCKELLEPLGVPMRLLPGAVEAGTKSGSLRPAIADELGLPADTPVVEVGTHDTASAVVAAPLQGPGSAYLSSGTWSLLGLELDAPLRTDAALAANFTNEAGVNGTTRFLKNIAGLWLIQECRRVWAEQGRLQSFAQIASLAEGYARPWSVLVNPNDTRFGAPGNMPARLIEAAAESGQTLADDPAAIGRCVFDSLALCYDATLRMAERLSKRSIDALHIVGGGGQNKLLNQITADAIGRPVIVGPVEGTVIGNAVVQAMALGAVKDLAHARQIVRHSFPPETCTPRSDVDLTDARRRFAQLLGRWAVNVTVCGKPSISVAGAFVAPTGETSHRLAGC
jgi:rhamnulokinase